jgi:hypothetical protein
MATSGRGCASAAEGAVPTCATAASCGPKEHNAATRARRPVRANARRTDILFMRSVGIHARQRGFFALRWTPEAVVSALGLAALIAVAVTTASADALPFVPPAGWQALRPQAGLLGVWVHPGDATFHQNLVVGRERTDLTASAFDASTIKQLRTALQNFQLGADQYTTVCNGRPAHYLSYASTVNGARVIYEHMSTVSNGFAWFAIYTREADEPSLPEARQALTTLCGIEIHTAAPGLPPAQQGQNQLPTPEPTPTPTYAPVNLTDPTFYTPTPIPKPSY